MGKMEGLDLMEGNRLIKILAFYLQMSEVSRVCECEIQNCKEIQKYSVRMQNQGISHRRLM